MRDRSEVLYAKVLTMIPCELSDGNARIDSFPDTVHTRGVLSVSIRGCTHEPHMLHDALFAV